MWLLLLLLVCVRVCVCEGVNNFAHSNHNHNPNFFFFFVATGQIWKIHGILTRNWHYQGQGTIDTSCFIAPNTKCHHHQEECKCSLCQSHCCFDRHDSRICTRTTLVTLSSSTESLVGLDGRNGGTCRIVSIQRRCWQL